MSKKLKVKDLKAKPLTPEEKERDANSFRAMKEEKLLIKGVDDAKLPEPLKVEAEANTASIDRAKKEAMYSAMVCCIAACARLQALESRLHDPLGSFPLDAADMAERGKLLQIWREMGEDKQIRIAMATKELAYEFENAAKVI